MLSSTRPATLRLTGLYAAGALALAACAPADVAAQTEEVEVNAVQDALEANRQAVSSAFERWAAGGSDFFTDILAPDVVWTIQGSGPSARAYQSRDAFMAEAVQPFATRMASPVRPVSHRLWADGDHVIVQWVGEGTAGDGRDYRNTYAWIFRMRDGKAVEVDAFLDLTAYDDVLRRVPAPASRPTPPLETKR